MDDTLMISPRVSPVRVAGVTLGLSAAGAVFGGLAGATAFVIGLVATGGVAGPIREFSAAWFPAMIGAGLGAVLAPLAGWLLLRDVPLGRVFRGLTIGTVIGGVAGWFAMPLMDHGNPLTLPIVTAGIGFGISAMVMRILRRRRKPGEPVTAA